MQSVTGFSGSTCVRQFGPIDHKPCMKGKGLWKKYGFCSVLWLQNPIDGEGIRLDRFEAGITDIKIACGSHDFLGNVPWLVVENGIINYPSEDVDSIKYPVAASVSDVLAPEQEGLFLSALYDLIMAYPPKPHAVGAIRGGKEREDPGVYHFGWWDLSGSVIRYTMESRQAHVLNFFSRPAVLVALDAARRVFKKLLPAEYDLYTLAWERSGGLFGVPRDCPLRRALFPFSLAAINVAPSYGYHIDGNDSALPGMVLALGPASAPLLLINGKILLYTRQRGMSIAAFHDCEHMVLDCGIPTGCNPAPVRSGFRISVVLTGHRRVHAIPSGKQYVVATDHHGASSRNVHTTGQKRAYKVAQDIKEYLLTS